MASKLAIELVIGAAVKPAVGAVFVAIEDRIRRLQRMFGTLDMLSRLDFETLRQEVEAAEVEQVVPPAPEQVDYNKQLNIGLATVAAFFLGVKGLASGRGGSLRPMASRQPKALPANGVGKLGRRVALAEAGIKAVGTWLTAKTPEEKAEGYGGALGSLWGARVGAAIGRRGGPAGAAAGEMVGGLLGEGLGATVAKRWFTDADDRAPSDGNMDKGPCCTHKPDTAVQCVVCPAPAVTTALPANPASPLLLASAALGGAVVGSKVVVGGAGAEMPPDEGKGVPAPPGPTPADTVPPARTAGRKMLGAARGAAPLALLEAGIKAVYTFMTAQTREQKAEGYGGAVGGLGGALLGAAVGSVIPVIGPPVGAAIGALLFGVAGDKLGSNLAKRWFAGSAEEKPSARAVETAKLDRPDPGALVRAQTAMAPAPRLIPILTRMGSMAPPATASDALPAAATAPAPQINQQFNFTSNMPITVQGCMTDPAQLAQTIEPMVRRQFEALIRQAASRQLYDVPHVA